MQRALGIGYGRASRLIDFMAEDGIVGEFKKGEPREVLYSWEEWEALKNGAVLPPEAAQNELTTAGPRNPRPVPGRPVHPGRSKAGDCHETSRGLRPGLELAMVWR